MATKCYGWAAGLASLGLVASQAFAQETVSPDTMDKDWTVLVGAGAFVGPEYLGSKDYAFQPAPIGTIQKGPFFVKLTGTTLTANVLPLETIYAGPLIGYGGGRKDVKDNVVKKLDEVDAELWLGGVVGAGYDGLMLQRDRIGARIEIAHDVMGDSGTTATFSAGYEINATERLAFGVDLSTTYVTADYADAYYSVSASGSAASGLSRYKADAGFRDISLNVSSRFAVTENWGVGGTAGASYLLGDMADSPIVEERGARTNAQGGLFLYYNF
ncbi:MipA/OmpV family protein [Roseibium denhamense]|uniref:Outer membrane scaffolding protein for murein synthesis, MipA/OmpV family n=1 Tax=Roseibium denhamense TaxID=76305 RepID=A0ABY1P325_9HYPH|nr:MipA/OmpV family protein [Roseibium denhamense]MTI07580.1 MipA/OmpV family protein [Roseibium denhamense]SMP23913.1 Outer membrane scaffolding protein for murein synthesis, MipA/OmpV family [Roseibium denhamense]